VALLRSTVTDREEANSFDVGNLLKEVLNAEGVIVSKEAAATRTWTSWDCEQCENWASGRPSRQRIRGPDGTASSIICITSSANAM